MKVVDGLQLTTTVPAVEGYRSPKRTLVYGTYNVKIILDLDSNPLHRMTWYRTRVDGEVKHQNLVSNSMVKR